MVTAEIHSKSSRYSHELAIANKNPVILTEQQRQYDSLIGMYLVYWYSRNNSMSTELIAKMLET